MADWYILDDAGNPVLCNDAEARMRWREKHGGRTRGVADALIRSVRVSTVFLERDERHENDGDGPPVLWETFVFGGPLDMECERYTSRSDALHGHNRMVERVLAAEHLRCQHCGHAEPASKADKLALGLSDADDR